MENLAVLNMDELYLIEGGKKSVSDWLLMGGGIFACFLCPEVGVPYTILVFALT